MLTHYDVQRALTLYDLGDLRSTCTAAHGLVNETAFAETSSGRYVIRRNQRRLGRASLELRHQLHDWLSTHDVPCPRLIPARSGETSVELDGRIFEVATFIEGEEYCPARPAESASVGSTLATYHHAVIGFPGQPIIQPPRYNPSVLLGLTERLMQRDMLGDLTVQLSWYDRRAADLRAHLSDEAYANLPHVLIHGDVHRDNMLFWHDKVVGLLDFDQVTIDARVVDMADALVAFAQGKPPENWSPWGVYDGPLDDERIRLLMGGYESVSPLSPAECAAMPLLLEVLWLQGNLRRVLTTPEAEPDYHIEVLEQGRWLAEWIQQHRP
ncbi:homoserine kinase [Chloroflexales bacterium ZM16-3]|nr:homoserine kinase [Chloroflexales bacterium ZM16-3]